MYRSNLMRQLYHGDPDDLVTLRPSRRISEFHDLYMALPKEEIDADLMQWMHPHARPVVLTGGPVTTVEPRDPIDWRDIDLIPHHEPSLPAPATNVELLGYARHEDVGGHCAEFVRILWRAYTGTKMNWRTPWFYPDPHPTLDRLLYLMARETGKMPAAVHVTDWGRRTCVPLVCNSAEQLDAALVVEVHRGPQGVVLSSHVALLLPRAYPVTLSQITHESHWQKFLDHVRKFIGKQQVLSSVYSGGFFQLKTTYGNRDLPYPSDVALTLDFPTFTIDGFFARKLTYHATRTELHLSSCFAQSKGIACNSTTIERCVCCPNAHSRRAFIVHSDGSIRISRRNHHTEEILARYPVGPDCSPWNAMIMAVHAARAEKRLWLTTRQQFSLALTAGSVSQPISEIDRAITNGLDLRAAAIPDGPALRDEVCPSVTLERQMPLAGHQGQACYCGAIAQKSGLCKSCSNQISCNVCGQRLNAAKMCNFHGWRKGSLHIPPLPAHNMVARNFVFGQRALSSPGALPLPDFTVPVIAGIKPYKQSDDFKYLERAQNVQHFRWRKSVTPATLQFAAVDCNLPIVLTPTERSLKVSSCTRHHIPTSPAIVPAMQKEMQDVLVKWVKRHLPRNVLNIPPVYSRAFYEELQEAMHAFPPNKRAAINEAWRSARRNGVTHPDTKLVGMMKWEKKSGHNELIPLGPSPAPAARSWVEDLSKADIGVGAFEYPISALTTGRLIQYFPTNVFSAINLVITHRLGKWMKQTFNTRCRFLYGGGKDAAETAVALTTWLDLYRPAFLREVDKSKWDSHQRGIIFDTGLILRHLLHDSVYRDPIFAQYFETYSQPLVVDVVDNMRKRMFRVKGPWVRTSGDPYTTYDNTFLLTLVNMYVVGRVYANRTARTMSPELIDEALNVLNFVQVVSGDDQILGADDASLLTDMEAVNVCLGLPSTGSSVVPRDRLSCLTFLAARCVRTQQGPLMVPDLMRWITSASFKLNTTLSDADWRDAVFSGWQYLNKIPIHREFIAYMARNSKIVELTDAKKTTLDPSWIHKPSKFCSGAFTPNRDTIFDLANAYCGGDIGELVKLEDEIRTILADHNGPVLFRSQRLDNALGRARGI